MSQVGNLAGRVGSLESQKMEPWASLTVTIAVVIIRCKFHSEFLPPDHAYAATQAPTWTPSTGGGGFLTKQEVKDDPCENGLGLGLGLVLAVE